MLVLKREGEFYLLEEISSLLRIKKFTITHIPYVSHCNVIAKIFYGKFISKLILLQFIDVYHCFIYIILIFLF